MLLRRHIWSICSECFLASAWVPSGRGSSRLLHSDGEDVAQQRIAGDGEGKHGSLWLVLALCRRMQKLQPVNIYR